MKLQEDTKNSSLFMLLAEIDSAEAMLAVAQNVRDPTIRRQYRQDTLEAYEGCLKLILGTSMGDQQDREVSNRLAPIRHWLERVGLLKR